MKFSVLFSLLIITYVSTCFAQEENEHLKLKNEGNESLRSQDYKKALESYEAAITVWPAEEAPDAAMIYNSAECARRINEHEKAIAYFSQALELNYRPDRAAYNIASALRTLNREEEMEVILLKAIDTYQTSNILGHMTKMLVTYYLKQGAEHYNRASQILASATNANPSQYDEITQKANEAFAESKPWFEKALQYDAENESAISSLKEINNRLSEKK